MPEGDTIFRAAHTLNRALADTLVTRFSQSIMDTSGLVPVVMTSVVASARMPMTPIAASNRPTALPAMWPTVATPHRAHPASPVPPVSISYVTQVGFRG